MAKKLSDEELISICRREEQTGQQWQDAELLGPRQAAFNAYNRDPVAYGVEEGQSSVVTSEVADTVESVMPGLMRVFASGDEIAKFTPMAEQDEQWAKEATQFVPHVLMRENDGYRIQYWFFKDVLLYRVATLTVDVEEVEKTRKDVVQGWTEEQMAMAEEMALEKGFTDVEFDVKQDSGGVGQVPTVLAPSAEGPGDMGPPAPTFSGTITTTRKKKRVRVDNVAPEDLLVSPADTRDIDEASFVGFRKKTTASELRVLGLSQEDIESLPADRRSSPEEDQRQDGQSQSQPRKDDQRTLWLVVAYVKVDMEGDGISEMWRCVYAHAGGNSPSGALIEKAKWEDGEAPIIIGSAILMPHSIVGRSLYDQTSDLQDVGTALTRGMLDNVYATNRPRPLINGRVNINQVLDWTPGMPIQSEGATNPMENIGFMQIPSIIEPALAALGYLENKRDQRTGTSRLGNNMDSDALSDASRMTKGGTSMVMGVAQERQELMANTLAHQLTRLFRHIYRAIKRSYGESKESTKYFANGEWQECHPQSWPDDMHLIVSVGTSNKQQEQMNLLGIGGAQEKIWTAQGGPGPGLQLEHIVNTGRKLAEASGYRSTTQFFPSSKDVQAAVQQQAQQPPQPPPEVQAEQAKTQGAIEVQKAQLAGDLQQMQAEAQVNAAKAQQDAQVKAMELQAKRDMETLQYQLAQEEMQLKREELELKRIELQAKREEMQVSSANAARDQEHERHMGGLKARDAEEQRRYDFESANAERAAKKEEVAAKAETQKPKDPEKAKADPAIGALLVATSNLTKATQALADAQMHDTEVVTSSGKTLRARKVPRGMN